MSDYRIEAKIRNARLLRAIESIGESPTGFAKKRGLNISRMCEIVAMKTAPVNATGDWWPEVMAICEATRKMPSDLFTERQMKRAEKTSIVKDVEEADLAIESQVATQDLLPPPECRIDAKRAATEVFEWLCEKNPRAAKAVSMHHEGATLEEIGGEIGASRERVRQIVAKSTRQMRERLRIKWRAESFEDLAG